MVHVDFMAVVRFRSAYNIHCCRQRLWQPTFQQFNRNVDPYRIVGGITPRASVEPSLIQVVLFVSSLHARGADQQSLAPAFTTNGLSAEAVAAGAVKSIDRHRSQLTTCFQATHHLHAQCCL